MSRPIWERLRRLQRLRERLTKEVAALDSEIAETIEARGLYLELVIVINRRFIASPSLEWLSARNNSSWRTVR